MYHVRLRDTYVCLARAAVPDRFQVHYGGLAVVVSVLMTVSMIVTMSFAMVVAVAAMRVVVPVVLCRERQCVSFSSVMVRRSGPDHVQMPRLLCSNLGRYSLRS